MVQKAPPVIKNYLMKHMRLYSTVGLLLITYTYSLSQKIQYPEFKGPQSSFQNYVRSELLKADAIFSNTCDISLGLVEFYVSKDGNVKSIKISESFPEEVRNKLNEIVLTSSWSIMKVNNSPIESLPIILPVYISIELGCKDGFVRRGFGIEKDFREMLVKPENQSFVNCILLDPFTYVLPIGFQDLDPKKD